jgi:carbon monoxide dehydrogenase subunit G
MSHLFTIDQTIAADTGRVFERLTDFENWKEWMPNLVSLERLNDKPMGQGFAWRETRKFFGRTAAESFEVRLYEPHHAFAVVCDGTKGSMGQGQFDIRYDLIPKGGLTQLSVMTEVSGLSFWGGLGFRLFGGAFKRALAGDVHALRRYIERVKMDWHDSNM